MSTNPTTNSTPAEGAAAPAKPKMPTTERVIKSELNTPFHFDYCFDIVKGNGSDMHATTVQNLLDVNINWGEFLPVSWLPPSALLQLCWTPVTSLNLPYF